MQITIEMPQELLALLDTVAERSGKNREELTQEALEMLLIRNQYGEELLDSLLTGITSADNEDFASDNEVNDVFQRYGAR